MSAAPGPARAAGLDASGAADAVAGDSAEYLATPELVAGLLAERLAALHRVAVPQDAGAEMDPASVVDAARRALAGGTLTTDGLPVAYRHVAPARLVEVLADRAEGIAPRSSPVITHGAPTLSRLRCRHGAGVGFVDWSSAAVADRHRDLAVAATDVAATVGPVLVPVLVEAYRAATVDLGPPDAVLLDWWALAAALLPPPPPPPGRPPAAVGIPSAGGG